MTSLFSRGFRGRPRSGTAARLPPGQYETRDFPVLSAGPTPRVSLAAYHHLGIEFEVAKFPWGALSRAITVDRPDGLTKLVLEKGTGRILGVGIAGSGAGELIAEGVLTIEMGATAEDLKLVIHPHPTLSESLMESAEVFFGQSTHVYKPKRK